MELAGKVDSFPPRPSLPDDLHVTGELEQLLDVVPRFGDIIDNQDADTRYAHGCFSPGRRTDFGVGS